MWTLYTSSGDPTLLNAIFNGVAMIASNLSLVWGFALLASMWLITRANAAAVIETHRHAAGPVLTRGAYHSIMPLVLAMILTTPDLKVNLTIENTTTGVVTSVANVPMAIAAIPVAGSLMGHTVGPAITTAMSGVNPAYGDITVSGHGFIDPMRRLLAARGAIEHLGSADTELRIVLGRCLSMEAGTDFTKLNNLVMNAGNSGATAAQSIPINGANPTGVGALLYQAAQNTTGLVPELAIGNTTILNCADAAALVASDLTNALNSVEFARVVQGAVNGMDQPLPGADFSVGQLTNEYNAMRNWNSMSGTLAIGSAQANAEMINFLFDEEVSAGLNCAQASESNKTVCEATMIQATELERNNLQAAANEVPMLQYAGSFANYILALIIGLGPVIVMFMMLFGVDGGKCIKSAAHIMVWPLLVTDVGAELINAMLTMQFSNFVHSISQGGYLSPAAIHSAYKELSLQVGVGSHLMASLPVLMSAIFALGEAAAVASVAAEVTPKGDETGKAEAPSPIETAPLMRATSPTTLRQFEGGGGFQIEAEGMRNAASGSATYKSLSQSASKTVSDTDSRETRESQERSSVHRFAEALAHRDYQSLGLSDSQGESLRKELNNNLRESGQDLDSISTGTNRSNSRGASTGLGAGIAGSLGSRTDAGVNAGANAGLSIGATDTQSATASDTRSNEINLAKAVSKTLSGDVGRQVTEQAGGEASKSLSNERSSADSYVQSVTHRDAHTSAQGHALQESDGFVAATQSIRAGELVKQAESNDEFRHFQRMEGNKFESLEGASKHMALAERDMASHSTEDVGGDERGRTAVVRHMAATTMARDSSLPESTRYAALKYLVGESNAMLHGNFDAPKEGAFDSHAKPIALPKDATGVSAGAVRGEASRATQGSANLTDPTQRIDPHARAGLLALHGAAGANADSMLQGVKTPSGTRASDAVDGGLNRAREGGLLDGADAKSLGGRLAATWADSTNAGGASRPPAPAPAPAPASADKDNDAYTPQM